MKKWFLFLIFIACAIPSCELKEVGPEQTTFPVITDEGATIEDGGGYLRFRKFMCRPIYRTSTVHSTLR